MDHYIRLICATSSPDGYEDYEHAVIDINQQLAFELLGRLRVSQAFASDPEFYRADFHDNNVACHSNILFWHDDQLPDAEHIEDRLTALEWVEVSSELELGEWSPVATTSMCVGATDILWKIYPSDGFAVIETQTLTENQIGGYLQKAHCHELCCISTFAALCYQKGETACYRTW